MRSALLLAFVSCGWGATYRAVVVPDSAHPAVKSAARILERVAVHEGAGGTITLVVEPAPGDGYHIVFTNRSARIVGNRPRSLLYAAGDYRLWKDRTSGTFRR